MDGKIEELALMRNRKKFSIFDTLNKMTSQLEYQLEFIDNSNEDREIDNCNENKDIGIEEVLNSTRYNLFLESTSIIITSYYILYRGNYSTYMEIMPRMILLGLCIYLPMSFGADNLLIYATNKFSKSIEPSLNCNEMANVNLDYVNLRKEAFKSKYTSGYFI